MRTCRLVLPALLFTAMAGFAVAIAAPVAKNPKPSADGGSPSAGRTGRPICVRVGTRSEGWAWPSGRFIHWAKCKGVVPKCHPVDRKHGVEGWYAHGVLIAPDRCAKGHKKRNPEAESGCRNSEK